MHDEQPDSPTRGPESTTGTLSDWTGVDAIVDEMLQVLSHANSPRKLEYSSVARRSNDTRASYTLYLCLHTPDPDEDVLDGIGELEDVDIPRRC